MAESILVKTVEVEAATEVVEPIVNPELMPLKADRDRPFRILILGDFAGRKRDTSRAICIRRHALDDAFRSVAPELEIETEHDNFLLRFHSLRDFEPAPLLQQLELVDGSGTRPLDPAIDRPELLRSVLHHPAFQELEAAWRSLDFLVNRLERHEKLHFHLVDVSKEELLATLLRAEDFRASDIYRLIVEESLLAHGNPWTLLVGNFEFDRSSSEDVELLERLGLLARASGAPFLAEALPLEHGEKDADRSWRVLRCSNNAGWVGLAMPRILLRSPYNAGSSACAGFLFEELEDPPQHHHFLWGNPAFACAYLLAEAFLVYGWDLKPLPMQQIQGLPLHVSQRQNGSHPQPCAEILLTDKDCESLLDEGLIPIASVEGHGAVRLIKFQSIAQPQAPLSGRWL